MHHHTFGSVISSFRSKLGGAADFVDNTPDIIGYAGRTHGALAYFLATIRILLSFFLWWSVNRGVQHVSHTHTVLHESAAQKEEIPRSGGVPKAGGGGR